MNESQQALEEEYDSIELELDLQVKECKADAFDYFPLLPKPIKAAEIDFNQYGRRNNYLKGCKWAPDGSCLMTCSEDQQVRLFNLPFELSQVPVQLPFDSADQSQLQPIRMQSVLDIQESGLIYDFCFNSKMNSNDPDSCL